MGTSKRSERFQMFHGSILRCYYAILQSTPSALPATLFCWVDDFTASYALYITRKGRHTAGVRTHTSFALFSDESGEEYDHMGTAIITLLAADMLLR